jgi:hypothetical protein
MEATALNRFNRMSPSKDTSPRNLNRGNYPISVPPELRMQSEATVLPKKVKATAIMSASTTESNNAQTAMTSRMLASTYVERAKHALLERIVQIPGVHVSLSGSRGLGESTIRVVVPDILGPTATQVRMAEIYTRRQFRDVRLDLEIEEGEVSEAGQLLSMNAA